MLVVANEEAGSAERDAVASAMAILGEAEPVELVYSRDRGHLDEILDERDDRRLVIAGGDGSLHAIVAALFARNELADSTLGLIPLGTGNDLARGLGISLDPETAARIIVEGHSRDLDLLVDDAGGVVVNAVHLGVGASAAQAAGAFKARLGRFAYPAGAMSAGVRAAGWRLVIRVDGEPVAASFDRVLMVAVLNGPSIGGGMAQVHPNAALDDGVAEVVVSGAVRPTARIAYAVDLARGKHLGRPDVQVHRGRNVAVTGDAFLTVSDGEIDGPMTHRTWTLEPAAWRLAVPRPAGRAPIEHSSDAGDP